ncbi:unnamed protein product [Lactuca virosa]|uniref:Uncharacterized protein n=1 Tax=Lactuca virosa TaxID=75947 RepID=A0AAU9N516_9ASTR|nr:unnamed protein product [Lactuca virosa]
MGKTHTYTLLGSCYRFVHECVFYTTLILYAPYLHPAPPDGYRRNISIYLINYKASLSVPLSNNSSIFSKGNKLPKHELEILEIDVELITINAIKTLRNVLDFSCLSVCHHFSVHTSEKGHGVHKSRGNEKIFTWRRG